ncbi:MAG: Aureobasidin resistance protein Aur1 [Bogoriella megaspora]|nr:MAG: Aureobasidin resistance protein Aur1 [Bogoriella megaspora]
MFVFGPPGVVPQFARAFGYMNLVGVVIQLLFPCSAPWYENMYGLAPADYSIPGSPAGLAAIDKLFGIDLYTSTFTASPLVFGAFPSLHAANATIEALFMSHVFPKLKPVFIAYALWIWWATMYLSHHYAVDLVGGSLRKLISTRATFVRSLTESKVACIAFFISKSNFLPRIQPDKTFRWDYDYVEVGESNENHGYNLAELDDFPSGALDSDEWTIGSSSSFSSGHRSPAAGIRSPTDDTHSVHSLWEGDTLGSSSDTEAQR